MIGQPSVIPTFVLMIVAAVAILWWIFCFFQIWLCVDYNVNKYSMYSKNFKNKHTNHKYITHIHRSSHIIKLITNIFGNQTFLTYRWYRDSSLSTGSFHLRLWQWLRWWWLQGRSKGSTPMSAGRRTGRRFHHGKRTGMGLKRHGSARQRVT